MSNKDELTPSGEKLFLGERGGKYYVNKIGKKVYIKNCRRNRKKAYFTPPRGAFARYLNHQQELL